MVEKRLKEYILNEERNPQKITKCSNKYVWGNFWYNWKPHNVAVISPEECIRNSHDPNLINQMIYGASLLFEEFLIVNKTL